MPSCSSPANASPDSLSTTRFHPPSRLATLCCPSLSGTEIGPLLVPRWLCCANPLGFQEAHTPSRFDGGAGEIHPGTSIIAEALGLTDLEADKAAHGYARFVDNLLDCLLVVLDERLTEQRRVLEEAVEPALHDLGQCLLRLALLARGGLGDTALVLDDVGRHVVPADVLR